MSVNLLIRKGNRVDWSYSTLLVMLLDIIVFLYSFVNKVQLRVLNILCLNKNNF